MKYHNFKKCNNNFDDLVVTLATAATDKKPNTPQSVQGPLRLMSQLAEILAQTLHILPVGTLVPVRVKNELQIMIYVHKYINTV